MPKVKFGETELSVVRVVGSKEVIKGAQRDVLTFHFETDAAESLEALIKKIGTPAQLTIISDTQKEEGTENPKTFIYKDYTILTKRSIESELVKPETSEKPAEYKDVYIVGLAQMTYTEKLLAQLQAAKPAAAPDAAPTETA